MILYRPVGLQELALIYDGGMKAFPARLPQQPIFYPVLQLEYARQTASGWNAKNGQLAGYVTQFKVEDEYIRQFETHTVGKSKHQELWIPAEDMEEFNKHLVGHIKVVEAHFGNAFEGFVPEQFGLQGKNAVEQFTILANSYLYKRMDFYLEIKRNHKAVFLNYPFWQTYEFKNPGLKEKIIQAIKEAWLTSFPKTPLPLPPVHEETPPAKQPPARAQRLVDPVEEDVIPNEETETDSSTSPVREESTHVKQINSHVLSNPVEEDLISLKQKHAQTWRELIEEDVAFVEQTDSDSSVDLVDEEATDVEQSDSRLYVSPVHEETTPVEQTDSHSLINTMDEDLIAEEETDSYSLSDLIEEDSTPAEQPDVPLLARPVYEEIAPKEKTDSYSSVNPVHDNTALPRQRDSHLVQGIQLGLSGRYREAIDALSRAIKEDPDHVIAHTSLGVAFHRVGDDGRALTSYETALRKDPKHAEAHYFRANILYSQGKVREAIAGYTVAIGLKPELIAAHEQPAPADRLTDYTRFPAEMPMIARPAHRILELNQSLKSNFRQAKRFKQRAAEYYRLWNYEQTIADYTSSLAIQPDDGDALHLRGVAYEQLGKIDRAQEDYRQAMAINSQLADVYLQRGVEFGNLGNLRQSIASLTEGIRLAPQNPDGYFNRGTAHLQQGDFARAIEDFSSVIRLSPKDETAYYWRGICNEEAGHQEEAIADYREFLAISQDPRARAEIERKLSRWNQGKRNEARSQPTASEDRHTTNQVESQAPERNIDLYDLVSALGERALNSTWLISGVECYGEQAEELYSLADSNQPSEGQDFLRITSGIDQTMQGDFLAFDPGSTSHWILIRAWEGSGFYIEVSDPKSRERLQTHFSSMEEVEGATSPYEGLFIRVESN